MTSDITRERTREPSSGPSAPSRHIWVAFGAAGAVGTVRANDDGFTFTLLSDDSPRASYPTLAVAKSALHAALGRGADWPEFREH